MEPESFVMEVGDVIAINDEPFLISRLQPWSERPDVPVPAEWEDSIRRNAVIASMRRLGDVTDTKRHAVAAMPSGPVREHSNYRMVSKNHDEQHYPTCSSCGQLWPCKEVRTMRDARQFADDIERMMLDSTMDTTERP